ncbi:hypothetical protein [Streptomyces sp. ISL-11]|uniref:hypothetical protein n=1 Tax=Streptomyces sp. ISL-11 TaxID=2819174 RepID=UPI00203640C5|nr:hypothetical protein [Streptomyces sp. ISL-11]
MDATQQHLLDLYRASQHHDPAPPAPGEGEWRLAREFRTWREFQAVVAGRTPGTGTRRAALLRLLRPQRPAASTAPTAPMAGAEQQTPAPARTAPLQTAPLPTAPLQTCSGPATPRA